MLSRYSNIRKKFLSKLRKLKNTGFFWLSLVLVVLFTVNVAFNDNADIARLPFYWDSINVFIDVQDNSDILVVETQKYVFNRDYSNQRYRYLSLDQVDKITDISVSEGV